MNIEVLNKIKRSGEKWEYLGRFQFKQQWIPVTGKISDMKTESQIKKAILKRIKSQADTFKAESEIPQEKTLSPDAVFKDIL